MIALSESCSFVSPRHVQSLFSRSYRGMDCTCRPLAHWNKKSAQGIVSRRARSLLANDEHSATTIFCTPGAQESAESNKSFVVTRNRIESKTGNVAHVPVLVDEAVAHAPSNPHIVVDGTVGAGGHAHALLSTYPSITQYIGIDKDDIALDLASRRLKAFEDTVRLVHGDFRHIARLTTEAGIVEGHADFVLLDVGVSSMQLDDPSRGFSFSKNGPLDMRMDHHGHGTIQSAQTAADIVNGASEDDLTVLIQTLGEEPQARRVARQIVTQRTTKPFETTTELATAVMEAKGGWRRKGFHPATLTFQALRVAVNDELHALQDGVFAAVNLLKPGGRICVISFHSLEDRIVKNALRSLTRVPGGVRIITKKPITAGELELRNNERSRSAKLRVAERVGEDVIGKPEKVNKYK